MAIVKNTIKEQVYKEMKKRILNRTYEPGTLLNIVHLSREFGVSNSPIREALAMLENEGLVTVSANTKFRVITLDEDFIQNLNAAICALLIGSIQMCISHGRRNNLAEQLEQILHIQRSQHEHVQDDPNLTAVNFDRTIVLATENQMLIKAFDNWSSLLYLSVSATEGTEENSILEHQRILDAVQSGTLPEIIQTIENHYNRHLK